MKKLKKIIQSNSFAGQPIFDQLTKVFSEAKEIYSAATQNFEQKQAAFQGKNIDKEADLEEVFNLNSEMKIAECFQTIRKIELEQAKFNLKNWIGQQPFQAFKGLNVEKSAKKTKIEVENTPENAKVVSEKKIKKVKIVAEKPAKKVKSTAEKTIKSKPSASKLEKSAKENQKVDDLKIIEGIGPVIETLLKKAGILSFSKLAKMHPTQLRNLLMENGARYKMYDPTSWPEQASFAANGNWNALKLLKAALKAGKQR
jgi:predicted flap endonuclease-1-like 5' DNA nuclease